MQNNTFKALFVGQKIITLRKIDSTNSYLRNLLSKSAPIAEGTVIMAENQFAGRGQFHNKWMSAPGKNLTFSILLCPEFLSPTQQFLLNIAVSIAINDVLQQIIGEECKIKWPNDIYYQEKKLGGVLIENVLRGASIRYSIVGIGLNVNEILSAEDAQRRATLKQIKGTRLNRFALLDKLRAVIAQRYNELKYCVLGEYMTCYLDRLLGKDQWRYFLVDGERIKGKIVSVEPSGLLCLEYNRQVRKFGLKELVFLFDQGT